MTKLTLPIEIGRRYVRRDGKVVTAKLCGLRELANVQIDGERDFGRGNDLVFLRTGSVDAAGPADPHDLIADAPEEPTTYAITDYAEVLRAIADGRAVQMPTYSRESWAEISPANVLPLIANRKTSPDQFRIKPDTITINGREVPAPIKVALKDGQDYWYAGLGGAEDWDKDTWISHEVDDARLSRGLIHLSEEAARQHAEALLSFTRSEG